MAYDPNEPRDAKGEWTAGAGGAQEKDLAEFTRRVANGTMPFIDGGDADFKTGRYIGLVAATVAEKQGFDPHKITVTNADYKFSVNGKNMDAAGTHDPKTGIITLYMKQIAAGSIQSVMTHEIMHAKFQAFLDDASAEQKQIMALPHSTGGSSYMKDDPMKADGTLREPYDKQFPTYQARTVLMEGTNTTPDLTAKMQKEDGLTPYSKDWWDTFTAGKTSSSHAYHETLSEMARLKYEDQVNRQSHADNIAYIREHGGKWSAAEERGWQKGMTRLTAPPTAKAPDEEGRRFLTTKPSKDWEALYSAVNENWNKRNRA